MLRFALTVFTFQCQFIQALSEPALTVMILFSASFIFAVMRVDRPILDGVNAYPSANPIS